MRKNKRLEKYGISQARHMELKYFCKQYYQKKEQLSSMTFLNGINYTGMPFSNSKTSKIEGLAVKCAGLKNDIEVIEDSAKKADNILWQAIIENVARGTDYNYLNVPCGRRYFYRAVENFFIILNEKNF